MAVKTTIGPKGVVTERISGAEDILVVNVDTPRDDVRTIVSGTGTVFMSGGLNMFVAPAEPVTAALPSVGSGEVGTRLTLLHDAGTNVVLVSGTNNINGTATVRFSASYGVLDLVAVKSDDDGNFHWHVLETTDPL